MAGQEEPINGHDKHSARRSTAPAVEKRHAAADDWDAEQQDDTTIVPLTRAEAETLFGPDVSRPSRVTPYRVVIAQVALSLVATLAWWLFSSKPPGAAAQSAFLGGAIGWAPSALFAARLRRGGADTVMGWVVGEVLKMGATIALFVAIAVWYPGVHWVPLLITYLLVLKTYWIALAWR
ncbi:ATP synthase subunit I [Burkholderia catarinensis]|uniref:ATP synthase subunit I n=1 Tax=Burkholderia catarinensis TaxID=1108140 RepID=UPI00091172D1|nr:ATP synthase subunit I [Burkholderia catarinensis]KAG8151536.1 F0F1 ATP synthase subunit I [Burkholderia catarinensis]